MKLQKKLLFLFFFCSLSSVFSQNKAEKKAEITSFQQAKKEAEKIIYFLLKEKIVPGVSITVTKQNKIVWQQGYGYADIDKKNQISPTETLFRIASVSKPLSAVALAKLQEKKKMDWNQSLYAYVADFPKKTADFSIKQLAGHLAGIRSYKGREYFSNKSMSIEQGVDMFKNDALLFSPGTKYFYSSFNWNLISLAMEKHLRDKFENIVNKEVLNPLQMQKTLPDRGEIIKDEAIPYSKTKNGFKKAPNVNNYYKLAGGGFLSTSDDIAKLGNAVLNGNFISQNIKDEMLTSLRTNDNVQTGYALGWQSSRDWANRPYYGHIGNGVGGYAWFFVYPEDEVVFVMFFNVSNPNINTHLRSIIDVTLEGLKL